MSPIPVPVCVPTLGPFLFLAAKEGDLPVEADSSLVSWLSSPFTFSEAILYLLGLLSHNFSLCFSTRFSISLYN